jgi:predicted RNA methylase
MDPGEMEAALASLAIEHGRFTFVDLGSGKGRALLMAALLPFRRIIGVEFAPALHRQSLENVRRFVHEEQRCRDIEPLCMDAATFEFPEEPLVIFMYNPFGPEVMREVVGRVLDSLRRAPRELYVLYANPFHADLWTEAGFVESARGDAFVLLMPPPRP